MNKTKAEYPKCPNCHNAMVFTFSFPHKEYACLPCNETDEFFPYNEKEVRTIKHMDSKKRLWGDELHRIAMLLNGDGARCGRLADTGKCHVCDNEGFEFKIWKSRLR